MSDKSVLGTKSITQIGIVVHDIEATAQSYADFFGVDKPKSIWTDVQELAQTQYRGEQSPARAQLAFFNMGSLQLELIQPDEGPSTWREHLDAHGEGVHHIAFLVEGIKEKITLMEGKSMPLLQKGEYTGGRYAYMDSFKELKVVLELLENDN